MGQLGEVYDPGFGPGYIVRYLRGAGTSVFGLNFSPRMMEWAQQLNPDISFREGGMTAIDVSDATLAGIAASYAIANTLREFPSWCFGKWRDC